MIDPELSREVTRAAESAAHAATTFDAGDFVERLERAAAHPDLAELAAQAARRGWLGALPTEEPVTASFPVERRGPRAVGIDGSQIFPDEKSPVQWAYIQAVAYCPGEAPLFASRFHDIGGLRRRGVSLDDLAGATSAWRGELELELAEAAARRWPDAVILLDGGLLPWGGRNASGQGTRLAALRGVPVAGVISAPYGALLAALVALAGEGEGHVPDRLVMSALLSPGERSARFAVGGKAAEAYRRMDLGVEFAFLRISEREIARVEFPFWAVEGELLGSTLAAALADSRLTGYAYSLSAAHQQAVIPLDLGRSLQERAEAVYYAKAHALAGAKTAFKRELAKG